MRIEFEIPDDILQSTVKESVMRQIAVVVGEEVRKQTANYKKPIERAVEEHLAKRLTDLELKGMIDKEVAERIRNLEF